MIRRIPLPAVTLQIGLSDLSSLELIFFVGLEVLSLLLGLTIAYTAYRGYRRNDSRPMLYIAVGFLLVLGVPAVLSAVGLGVRVEQIRIFIGMLVQISEVAGLVAILYALRMRR